MNNESSNSVPHPGLSKLPLYDRDKINTQSDDLFELSAAQKEMWVSTLVDPHQIYNIAGYVEILENIDINAFRSSCEVLVNETESLRTRFHNYNDNISQSFHDAEYFSYQYLDFSRKPNSIRLCHDFITKESYKPINTCSGQNYLFTLICIKRNHFILFQKYHHLIADGLSVALMLERLTEIYRSQIAGVEPTSNWFGSAQDYLISDRIYQESEAEKTGRQFWKKYLNHWEYPGPILDFLPPVQGHVARQVPVVMPLDIRRIFAKIMERRKCQFSTFSVAFAAFVLARITGQSDIVLSLPVTGRSRVSRKVPAFQSNILPLRILVTPETRLEELISIVSRETRRILRYSRVRGERVARDVLPRGSRSFGACVNVLDFNSNLLFSNIPSRYNNILLGPVWDLSISFYKDPSSGLEDFSISLEQPPLLHGGSDLVFLSERIVWIAEQVSCKLEIKMAHLDIIRPEERTLVLQTWNDTAAPWPESLCLHQMVEAQVRRTPDAPAVTCGETCLSYAELDTQANRLAHHLVALGVTPDDPVAICLDRSVEMVVGLLAILKAGGAYLPLDPAYPSSRLAQILDDARPAVILIDETGRSVIAQKLADIPICIDVRQDRQKWVQRPASNLEPAQLGLGSHNTAYIIYTSGSTGTPKGVPNTHCSVGNRLVWMQTAYCLTAADAVVQKTPFGFDVSVWEFFWPLLAGARLVMAKPGGHKDPEYLLGLIAREQITTIHFVPSMLELFLESAKTNKNSPLRTLICSGEALPLEVLKQCRTVLPHTAVHNLYGPTEAAIDVTAWSCPDDISTLVTVPIGRPIANTSIYLLDAQGQPVPPGVAGELYIGGAGVARGYLNRPDLTAERFLDDPFAATPGARMYRSGDLARYRPDGNIEFLGRADQQVKIRGFRIEPGEIEARLAECPGVRTAAVIAREDTPGDRRLVGYVVPQPDASPEPAALRRALAAVLPDYMVPAALVMLDTLPLTPNGKLDRKALPAPDFTPAGEGRAPRTPQEAVLAALFAEVLGLPRVGIDDSFFDLGGHSLLATRLASRIRSTLDVDLPVRAVFENPTVAGLTEAIAEQADSNRPPLVPMPRPAVLPLSFAQQRLWFLFRLEGPSATYNMPLSIQMDGPFDVAAMQAALGDVVGRHESLRTVFPEVDGIACQQVLEREDPRCAIRIDHRHVTEPALREALAAIAATPIDIAEEPPLRAVVLEVTPVRHVLVVLVHHIAADGWSMAPFARDLAQAYDARMAGAAPAFTPLPVQYADYTLWQRALLGSADDPDSLYSRQAKYWEHALAGLPECIDLPTDRPRPPVSAYQGATVPLTIPPELAGRLAALGRATGSSVFMILQAALAVLLGKLGAGDDIAIGSPIAGRTETSLENLVGFFVNTLVLRTDLSGNPTVADLIAQVRDRSLAAYGNQDLPFEKLVEILNPARAQNHHPLFQVMLVLQNTAATQLELTGLQARELPVDNTVAKFDLTVTLAEEHDGLVGEIEYDTALFDARTVEHVAARYLRVLDAFTVQQANPISSIDILDPAERTLLLQTWNDTSYDVPEATWPDLFETQVLANPEATAVIFEEQTLTYSALNQRANQFAHYLISCGIGPEDYVGLALPPSIDLIVVLLGILKSGAAYVPLDPDYPAERVSFMVSDCAPRLVVTTDRISSQQIFHSAHDILIFDASDLQEKLARHSVANPSDADRIAPLTLNNAAYVIYTSGSTGTPKGVVVTHSGIASHVACQKYRFALNSASRVLLFASINFDSSVGQICSGLLTGGALVMADRSRLTDPEQFSSIVRNNNINYIDVTPSFLGILSKNFIPESCLINAGGEELSVEIARFWMQTHKIFNSYGPSETTIDAIVSRQIRSSNEMLAIGRPVFNAKIYILDARGQPVPPGVAGELYIGGAGVARGYLNRPDLTAERFLDDPFAATPGARMYRSGDLARYRPDGNIEFLGRADQQVKIRGFRIEPGEIEARLAECPGVRTAAVIAREDTPGDRRLVGYVVPQPDASPEPAALRRALAAVLPDYMVPAALVMLDTLPLTPNGKLDRKALPAPDFTPAGEGRAPRTPQEAVLAALFAEVLGLPRVGIDDSFFDLGGHSLLATRLASRIRSTLDVDLPVRAVFENPTVAGLTEAIAEQADSNRPPLVPMPRPAVLPLSFAQQRLWFLFRLEGPSATYNMPLSIQMDGPFDVAAMQAALGDVVGRHESLRTVFPEVDGIACQQVLEREDPRCAIRIDHRHVTEPALREALAAIAATPIDIAEEPPLRAVVLEVTPVRHVLVVLVHHIAADGWSMAPFARELAQAYDARMAGAAPAFTPLPVQYADYTLWQRALLGSADDPDSLYSRQAKYWEHALAGLPECIDLPTDRPRPPVSVYQGATVPLTIPPELAGRLAALGRATGSSVFMILQAALAVLLGKLGAGDDIAIGSPIAGRTETSLENLVGFFVNTLVLRTDLSGNPTVADLIAQVRDRSLAAYGNQDLPFEKLVEILNPARAQNHHPLFQVMLVLQNTAATQLELTGLQARELPVDNTVAKFDLTVTLAEEHDGLVGEIEYDTALFDARTVEHVAARYLRVLDAFTVQQANPISSIDILDPAERTLLLQTWNDTAAPWPESLCLHQMVEAQVRRTPDAPAVTCGETCLSYAELDTQANRLAHHLVALGVTPDDPVAICLDRSVEMVVGLLAILKAGGAYLPLDPAYPSSRLAQILDDARPAIILIDEAGARALGEQVTQGMTRLHPRATMRPWDTCPDTTPDPVRVTPHNLAYVIYTSGSTGTPKGVAVEHRNIVASTVTRRTTYRTVKTDVHLLLSSVAFDSSIALLFGSLCSGSTLHIASSTVQHDPAEVSAYILQNRVTLTLCVPSFATYFSTAALRQISGLIVAGEACTAALANMLLQKNSSLQLFNEYGPTECTVWATVYRCPVAPTADPLSIGRPIANTSIYLLDAQGQPVPPGVAGELYIGGAGVARGYLNRPDLTAERFLDDPFAATPGARMYRSGDLARYRPDGNIEFLGRADQQVKIRGFRIEPGEIEARLAECPGVRTAAVIAREDTPGDRRLVGYVVPQPDASPEPAALRRALAAVLPDYMVPAALVMLDTLPLTPNGKLDRKALPAPDDSAFVRAQYVAPVGRVETALAEIWENLLQIERIGRTDNFFELGGHSLLAVQMMERLRRIGLPTEVRTLFGSPVLADLALAVGDSRSVVAPRNTIPENPAAITPDMLPLIDLTTDDIGRIAQLVPGGLANIQDIYALTPLQEGILFHHLLAEQGDPYLLTGQMAFPDRERLDSYLAAIQTIVDRHDILRTCFVWEGLSCAAQVVLRNARLSVTELSLDPTRGAITEQLAALFDPRIRQIDLGQPPLLRFVIAHDPEQKRWLLLEQLHHLIGDHSTLDVMNAEVLAILSGRKDTLRTPQPFRNLVAQTRLGVSQEEHETFFRSMLGDIDEPTLPFGMSDVHLDGVAVDEATLALPQTLNDRLREQARRLGVSLASLCHLAWGRVVSATSGRADVVFGTVLFGRMNAGEGADQTMGLFINTLPLRLTLDATPAADSVRATHAILAELLRHEHASLALAQKCSGVSAGTPLFSALLNYRHNQVSSQLDHDPTYQDLLHGVSFLGAEERTNYPLTLSVEDYGTTLGLTAQVVAPHDAAEICRYMEMVLSGLADALEREPARPVNTLTVLPPAERTLVLQTWNDTAAPWPESLCLHQMVEAQVRRTPDAPAVTCGETCLSYAELDTQANRLAHHLVALGVTPDDPVAICLDRSVEMVVGLLAILKAGGAYLPLDPAYPSSRLAQILDDARPAIILIDEAGARALGEQVTQGMTRLHPRATMRPWDTCPDTTPDPVRVTPHNLAYVIYTSGSTGTPKGVAVEHRNIVASTVTRRTTYRTVKTDVHLLLSSVAFDSSIALLFGSLCSGSTLHIASSTVQHDPAEVSAYILQNRVTLTLCVPSFATYFSTAALRQISGLIVAGEACTAALANMLLQKNSSLQLFNEYGPTECTVWATVYRCPVAPTADPLSIGRPIANTSIYLLDAQGQPVPPGVAGELYIGGAGVARGYLNRPDLTAERFLDDPFAATPGARMYRSGDLARYRPDGNIEFLGRADQQVKIRGFRIEPGEIEARLAECPGVRTAAVIAREDTPGDRRLVGYVVPQPDASPEPAALRRALAAVLPDYMVPAALVMLDTLPLTPNGKLDRKALPAPDDSAFVRAQYVAPVGRVETALAEIWENLLQIERIGRTDNFFELGGHSLLAVQMMERLRRIGLPTEVRTLFGSPVLADLALAVGDSRSVVAPRNTIPENPAAITPDMLPLIDLTTDDIGRIAQLVPGGLANIQDIYALTPLQEGILFHHLLAEQGDPYLLTGQMAFPDRERLDSYLAAIQTIVDRHDILRTCFVWEGLSCAAQVVLRNARLSVTELSLDPTRGAITEQLAALFDPRIRQIDLGQPPLLRFVIAHDPEQKRWLLLEQLHHLIGDHSTLDVMNAEVLAILSGRKDTLRTPQPFRNLVAQTRLGVSQEEHETFFRSMLGDIDEPTLPFGMSDVHLDGVAVDEATLALPQTLNDRLREQARRLGVSLASLCHLAWGRVVSATSGRADVVFGTVLFGRMNAGEGADQTMGLFINTLPLRLTLDATPAADSVRATHAILAELLRHEHASLALAQKCSGVSAGTPLFSALLNYRHNQVSSQLDHDPTYQDLLHGVSFLGAEERTNYPLTLSVEDYGTTLGLTAQVVAPHDAAEICRYMEMVLSGLADALEREPARPVNTLTVLPPAERTLVLQTWNDTAAPWPESLCLHQMVEAQVRRTPDAPAVTCGETCLSYAELDTQANRLAHHLVALGVTPDDPVAICLDRSVEMVVGLLAILKAGGAYLPLDPAYPSSRLAQILDDARPTIILIDEAGARALGEQVTQGMTRLHPRATMRPWDTCPDTTPDPVRVTPHNLAYVIYTSGSTGTPKGVAVEHRNIVSHTSWQMKEFAFSSTDRVLQRTSASFDAAGWEFWSTLSSGACLVIDADHQGARFADLFEIAHKHRITILQGVPSLFANAHLAPLAMGQTTLRCVFCGGEEADITLLQSLRALTDATFVNLYGPTEATIDALFWQLPTGIPHENEGRAPIGRPIANTSIYLLDAQGQPVPPGVAGELYIGGAGVARGYLNRPDLTAERFLDDPFAATPGARMYRSGDLARYRPDGNIEFLGRADQQVKIRGFRIEPGEIEARLAECPGVRTAAVIAREDTPGDRRLVGYVVPQPDASPEPAALRRALAAVLPDYMVPAALVMLDTLPLTPNGKLDRKALPAPDDSAFVRAQYVAPVGRVETALAEIWENLLQIERIGRTDNFFELGGHSLLAVQMMERLRRIGLPTEVRTLFGSPVLADLALAVGDSRSVVAPRNTIPENPAAITPDMLPLIDLTTDDIGRIAQLVPGGLANIQDIYALTPLQEGILFHHLLAEQGDPYLLTGQMAFPDRERLDSYLAAIQTIVDRHDILRTCFVWEGLSCAAQVVLRNARLSVTELSLDPTRGAITEQLAALFDPRIRQIDLGQPPLLRFVIAHDPEQKRWLLLEQLHHLIGDHSTLDVMNAEVLAILSGRKDTLRTPQPFRNLVAQTRLGVSQEEHETFFRSMLGDIDEPTLPFGMSDVHLDGVAVDEATLALPQTLNDRLREQARRLGVSLASLCHLAWGRVVSATSGRADVVFGTVLFGRMNAGEGADQTMGLFINTLPLRLTLDATPAADSVRATHAILAELLRHEHASLALAQKCSGVSAGTPLFSALLNYRHNQVSSQLDHDPTYQDLLHGVSFLGAEERTNYPLTLSVEDYGTTLGLTAQVVAPHDAAEICRYMEMVLSGLADALEREPARPVNTLTVLPPAERTLVLQTWNDTAAPWPESLCLHQMVEAQVRRTPDAPAVTCGETCLSYAELDTQANRLAHHLVALGVTPDDPVAICLDRSVEMVVGLLAILKAGGAYLPLDPAYPSSRLAQILDDARPAIILIDEAGARVLGKRVTQGMTRLHPRATMRPWDTCPDTTPDPVRVTPHNLAYVIYTSGSTGTPKGVAVEHRNAVHLASAEANFFDLSAETQVLQFASCSFDASIFEIVMALQTGGCLHIPTLAEKADASSLWHYMESNGITHATLPPAIFQFATDLTTLTAIRFLVLAGETPDPRVVQSLTTMTEGTVVNAYGPTETTVWATVYRCPVAPTADPLSIGRPIANTSIYLLDAQGQPVPPGVAGELYIGGAGVARGYLNRPDLTAERFLDDPFAATPGARMYRSGDLARYRPDGNIEFLGRADQQVKIRGFRIEPGEIEARLAECPGVRTAAVIAREDTPGDRRLVGYVVPQPDASPEPAALRRALAAVLPDYMVPAALVMLDTLPLTPNGKLDRKALPAPDFTPAGEGRAPRTPQEAVLAALFAEVLGLPRVGIDDSFFDLGGHSLLATRLASRIRSTLDVDLPVRAVFENPTVAGLTEAIAEQADSNRPPLVPMPRPAVLPLSFAQQRLWFLFRLEGPSATYNMPLSIQMDGPFDVAAMQAALGDVVGRHESLRTVFPEVDGIACQQVLEREDPRCAIRIDHRHVTEPALREALAAIAATPIDIAEEPPLRAVVLEVTPVRHVLVVLVHHIAADGWSMAPFARELAQAYDARMAGAAPAFTPLPVQYADYTLWQRALLGSADDPDSLYSRQAKYWEHALAGLPECIDLPTDRPRPPVSVYQGATVPLTIPPELAGRLAALGRATGSSVFMILQAALAVLLGKLGAGDDIAIGSPIAGRTETSLENLVGFFVNTLVLRTDLSGNPTVADLIAQVRDRSLAAYGNQDLPFEKLVEILNPARAQNHHPLFQVMLVLQNTAATQLELTGLQARELPVDNTVAKFDLTVTLAEEHDGLVGEIEYDTALFDARTVEHVAARYLRVLDAFTVQQANPISSIDILDPAERTLLLQTWNDTAAPWPESLCLHQMVEAQVRRTPDAPAVTCGETCLSYAELDTQANRLAHHLVALGVTPDDPVAICLDRSVEMVVGLLAILKAGGAYLPLDPAYPSSRLAQILDDARPAIILIDKAGARVLGEQVTQGMTRLHPRATMRPWDTCPDTTPDPVRVTPHNLAYVIYTSGSTGTPKGVAVEHRNAVHLASAEANFFDLSAETQVLQFASCSFDASIFEIVMALQTGGCLHIPTLAEKADASSLWHYMESNGITHATLPPAIFQFATDLTTLTAIRFLVLAGETPDPRVVQSLTTMTEGTVVNAYGPTETTVWATVYRCPVAPTADPLSIGRPIANTSIYLLDAQGQPVPPGVAGELYIGGAGVARGYLNRPDLTAERFLDDPFAATPGARMYRSGDLARYRPDGNIEFLGRADQQVKIRGFRIEPGEIEARLAECPGVRTAAVIAREDTPGDRRLVGYVVPQPDASPEPAALRRALAAVLPDYMVPAALVMLDTLPLTPNGKLDRKALPAPDFTPAGEGRAPRTPQEAVLAALFAEVLGLPRVGIDDSFFDLGGHSLLATRLASRIRSTLDIKLPVRALFETPTVAGLAALLGDGKSSPDGSLIALREAGLFAPLFCIHGGFGLVWPYRNLLDQLDPEIPLYAFQARGLEAGETLPHDMIALVDDYIEQMRRVQPFGPYHIVGWSFGAVAAQAMATRLQGQGEEIALLTLLDGYPSYNPQALEMHDGRDYETALQALMDEYGMQMVDPDTKQAIIAVFRNCTRIQLAYDPAVYSGDMLFFRAAEEPDPDASGDPAKWSPYLRGKMSVVDINASHSQMLEPHAAEEIAKSINDTVLK